MLTKSGVTITSFVKKINKRNGRVWRFFFLFFSYTVFFFVYLWDYILNGEEQKITSFSKEISYLFRNNRICRTYLKKKEDILAKITGIQTSISFHSFCQFSMLTVVIQIFNRIFQLFTVYRDRKRNKKPVFVESEAGKKTKNMWYG